MSKPRSSTTEIILHCSATPSSMDIGVAEIDRWHRARAFFMVGYHYIIRRDGKVEAGRDVDTIGAHAKGHNAYSVGICLVGGISDVVTNNPENNFTVDQWAALNQLVVDLGNKYPDAVVIGHNQVSSKACPSFDVTDWLHDVGLEGMAKAEAEGNTCPACGHPLS